MAKIGRDAFLYMEGAKSESFAQCGSCALYQSGISRCLILGPDIEVPPSATCGMYVEGKPIDSSPQALVTKDEVGFLDGPVRCENCISLSLRGPGSQPVCGLYAKLNSSLGAIFDLKTQVSPFGCCNAWEPKVQKANLTAILVGGVAKRAMRHGKKDIGYVQGAHDNLSALVDCAHCTGGMVAKETAAKAEVEKRNMRHAAVDLERIRQAHDIMCALGAKCMEA